MDMIARTYAGAINLYHGVPSLEGATVVKVIHEPDSKEYSTKLVLRTPSGEEHTITIKSAD